MKIYNSHKDKLRVVYKKMTKQQFIDIMLKQYPKIRIKDDCIVGLVYTVHLYDDYLTYEYKKPDWRLCDYDIFKYTFKNPYNPYIKKYSDFQTENDVCKFIEEYRLHLNLKIEHTNVIPNDILSCYEYDSFKRITCFGDEVMGSYNLNYQEICLLTHSMRYDMQLFGCDFMDAYIMNDYDIKLKKITDVTKPFLTINDNEVVIQYKSSYKKLYGLLFILEKIIRDRYPDYIFDEKIYEDVYKLWSGYRYTCLSDLGESELFKNYRRYVQNKDEKEQLIYFKYIVTVILTCNFETFDYTGNKNRYCKTTDIKYIE